MRTLVLDGSVDDDPQPLTVRRAVTDLRPAAQVVTARELSLGNCAGDFACWLRTPGLCRADDDNRKVAAAMVAADTMVLLTPVTYGGYSAPLKKVSDHLIQLVSPFFTLIDGEVHHRRRYDRYPDLVVVG